MRTRRTIADLDIQDYIDDRLDDIRRARLASELQQDSDLAREVQQLGLQNEILSMLGADVLSEPVPERLSNVVRQAAHGPNPQPNGSTPRRAFAMAAMALFVFVLGTGTGWLGRGLSQPDSDELSLILSDVESASTYYLSSEEFQVEFPAGQETGFTERMERAFERRIGQPDLSGRGYTYMGGRFFPRTRRNTGMFVFVNEQGSRVTIFFWPSEGTPQPKPRVAERGSSLTWFWTRDGLGFAVIGRNGNADLEVIAESVFEYYGRS